MTDVDVPAVGRVNKTWVYAGGAVVAGIVGMAWWKRRTAVPTVPVVDPATGTNSTDPTYRNPAPQVTTGDPKLAPSTDQEWTARVLASMTWMEPGHLAEVLGKYLSRQPITLAESAIIRTAWGLHSKPPGGQPIILSTDTSTPGGGTPPPPPPPPPPPGKPTTVQVGVKGGWHYDGWAQGMHAQGFQFDRATFDRLNPGVLAWANDGGFVGTANRNPARQFEVFGGDRTITLPAN